MPALLQVWIVIATIALLGIAVMTARMMARHISKAADDISRLTVAVSEAVEKINQVSNEAHELVASVRECVPPLQRVVGRFESIGQRTANISSALLQEVEGPVFTAAAVTRGVRTGAGHLLKQVIHRFTHRHSSINGDHDHE
jgi:hypothetical protein